MVGEFEARTGFCPFRVFGSGWPGRTSPPVPDPREVVLSFEAIAEVRSRYSVHDSRHAV
jgi:hypothetical protein